MLKFIYKLYFAWKENRSRSVSPVAPYLVTSTVQAVCTVSQAQKQSLLHCAFMDAIWEPSLELAFRVARLRGGGGTELALLSHRLKLDRKMLFTELISQFPSFREKLFRNHDVETLNLLTLKSTNLTLECLKVVDLRQ